MPWLNLNESLTLTLSYILLFMFHFVSRFELGPHQHNITIQNMPCILAKMWRHFLRTITVYHIRYPNKVKGRVEKKSREKGLWGEVGRYKGVWKTMDGNAGKRWRVDWSLSAVCGEGGGKGVGKEREEDKLGGRGGGKEKGAFTW